MRLSHALIWLAVTLLTIASPFLMFVWVSLEDKDRIRREHQAYVWLTSHFRHNANDWSSTFEIDFTTLNGGAWRFLCLYGGFESPQISAREFAGRNGLKITSMDH